MVPNMFNMAAPYDALGSTSEPPYCMVKIFLDGVLREKLQHVKSSLSHIMETEQLHKMLIAERQLLHVTVYKRSAQLRIEKSLQLVKRVRACLQRLHIVERLFSIANDMSLDINRTLNSQKDESVLPSQQVFSFVLHLTSSYYHLVEKMSEYCVAAFEQLCRAMQTRFASIYEVIHSLHLEIKATKSKWVCPIIPDKLLSPLSQSDTQDFHQSARLPSTYERKLTVTSHGDEMQSLHLNDVNKSKSYIPAQSSIETMEDLGVTVLAVNQKRKRNNHPFHSPKKIKTSLKQRLELKSSHPNSCLNFVKDDSVGSDDISRNIKIKRKKKKDIRHLPVCEPREINKCFQDLYGENNEELEKVNSCKFTSPQKMNKKMKRKKKLKKSSKKETLLFSSLENVPASASPSQESVQLSSKNKKKKSNQKKLLKKKEEGAQSGQFININHEKMLPSPQKIEVKSCMKKKENKKIFSKAGKEKQKKKLNLLKDFSKQGKKDRKKKGKKK